MASVNFERIKDASKAKAMFRHSDREERLKHEHTNEHINKAVTANNTQYKRSYKETCERYDNRISYLDKTTNTNKRKDRVTLIGMTIPFPVDLDTSKGDEWASKCLHIINEMYGAENVMQAYVHYDEQHAYKDALTGEERMSRAHMHVYVVPELEGKLNAKACATMPYILELNNRIHKMTEEQFDVQFMDGSHRKRKESVTELKNASRELALKQKEKDLKLKEQQLDDFEKRLLAVKTSLDEAIEKSHKDALERLSDIKARELALQAVEDACRASERAYEQAQAEVKEKFNEKIQLEESTSKKLIDTRAERLAKQEFEENKTI